MPAHLGSLAASSSLFAWMTLPTSLGSRALLAAAVSLAIVLLCGSAVIRLLASRLGTPQRQDSKRLAKLHAHKARTPSMGGLLVVGAWLIAALFMADLTSPFVQLALLTTVGLTALGAIDDLTKILNRGRGISGAAKLYAQGALALAAVFLVHLCGSEADPSIRIIPGLGWQIELGPWCIPFAVLAIVGTSNSVNLTDGLDGLAGGCLLFTAGALAFAAWSTMVPGETGEMLVLLAAMLGAVLGFLWFNCSPARIFLGDTGSLPLGGLLGLAAVVWKQELLLVILGGVFVLETLSVILQVGVFKLTRKRVFACAPLHHHFQFHGWPEGRIVTRFWFASAICATLGIALVARTEAEKQGPRFDRSAMEIRETVRR